MPAFERTPTSTTVVAAGWTNPTNAYILDNTYASTSTTTAEQSYSGYGFSHPMVGTETIDKVFVKIKHYITIAKTGADDATEVTCTLRVYNGSTWQNYQITNLVYANATPLTDEQPTVTVGDTSAEACSIDVTSFLNTLTKIAKAQTALLFTVVTAGAGVTVTWYVDAVTLLLCCSPTGGGFATTTRTYPQKTRKALDTVEQVLQTLSQT